MNARWASTTSFFAYAIAFLLFRHVARMPLAGTCSMPRRAISIDINARCFRVDGAKAQRKLTLHCADDEADDADAARQGRRSRERMPSSRDAAYRGDELPISICHGKRDDDWRQLITRQCLFDDIIFHAPHDARRNAGAISDDGQHLRHAHAMPTPRRRDSQAYDHAPRLYIIG